jgi:broad specificity phosphatase PhoE
MSTRSARRLTALTIGTALLALAGLGCSDSDTEPQGGSRSSQGSPAPDAGELMSRLRSGGLVVVFRHAATDPSDEDDPDVDLDDCTTQRNLTGEGRADARRIGAAFRELSIPAGAVWASPYCRARDTAELAFGRAQVVDGLERLYPTLDEAADRRLNRLIREEAPAPGGPNLVIAAHGVYPSALEPAVTLDEGEAAVYAVRGDDVALLGRVAPDEWAGLDSDGASANGAGELSDVAERVHRSVVSVQLREGEQAGAGFRVAVDGIVVTSAQVVGDADEVTVVLPDGTRRSARVLGRAPDVDVAALELDDDSGLPAMHSGSGLVEARVGDPALAVGSPLRPAGAVTSAVISGLRVPVRLGRDAELEALAIDAAIEPAQSGGPLVNDRGEVLGVITAIATPRAGGAPTGSGFVVPVDVARNASLEIVEGRG